MASLFSLVFGVKILLLVNVCAKKSQSRANSFNSVKLFNSVEKTVLLYFLLLKNDWPEANRMLFSFFKPYKNVTVHTTPFGKRAIKMREHRHSFTFQKAIQFFPFPCPRGCHVPPLSYAQNKYLNVNGCLNC